MIMYSKEYLEKVVYNAKLIAGEIKVSEKYQKAKGTIVICIINDNVVKKCILKFSHAKI